MKCSRAMLLWWVVLLRYGENTTRMRITDNPDKYARVGGVAVIGAFRTEDAALRTECKWQKARGLESRLAMGQQLCTELMLPYYVDKSVY